MSSLTVRELTKRGFDPLEWRASLAEYEHDPSGTNENRMTLAHPSNWMKEREAEDGATLSEILEELKN